MTRPTSIKPEHWGIKRDQDAQEAADIATAVDSAIGDDDDADIFGIVDTITVDVFTSLGFRPLQAPAIVNVPV